MTSVKQFLNRESRLLRRAQISDPLFEAEFLLSESLGKSREWLLAHPEAELGFGQRRQCRRWLRQRRRGVPSAYLAGKQGFYGREFLVSRRVLVPRPATELMIDTFLKQCLGPGQAKGALMAADIGTGSGCIAVTLAKELERSGYPLSLCRLQASDVSRQALALAVRNASIHGVSGRIRFLRGRWLEPHWRSLLAAPVPARLVLLANLPYLTPAQIAASPSIRREPRLALAGGPDGLLHYRALLGQIRRYLSACLAKGSPPALNLLFEIDGTQGRAMRALVKSVFPAARLEIKTDLHGEDRLCVIGIRP